MNGPGFQKYYYLFGSILRKIVVHKINADPDIAYND
jgi:hypothetical protein